MKHLPFALIEIDSIRLDGGTQVREALDEEWVEELRELYEDGHPIPRVLVVEDGDGTRWLADGFHRVEAMKRAGHSGTEADVRRGGVLMAKMLAAAANKNGLPRTAGDKRRAIELALSTPEGRKMKQSELAKYVGCSAGFMSKVKASFQGNPDQDQSEGIRKPRQSSVQTLHDQLGTFLRDNPEAGIKETADKFGCSPDAVRNRRRALGMPDVGRGRKPAKQDDAPKQPSEREQKRARALEALRAHPERPNVELAREAGCADEYIAKLRVEENVPRPKSEVPRAKPKPPPLAVDRWLPDMLQRIDKAGLEREDELRETLNARHAAREDRAA